VREKRACSTQRRAVAGRAGGRGRRALCSRRIRAGDRTL